MRGIKIYVLSALKKPHPALQGTWWHLPANGVLEVSLEALVRVDPGRTAGGISDGITL
jgi:hypothetical protein